MDGPTIVLSLLVLVSGFTIYAFLKLNNLERIAKIEKGLETEDLNSHFLGLKIGLLFIGIALGFLISYALSKLTKIDDDVVYPSLIFLFGGLSLVVSHFWVNKLSKK